MFGFMARKRRQSRDVPEAAGVVVRLEPAGRNLPERRSVTEDVGDLRSGRILQILAPEAASGAKVNESSALGMAAVFACSRLLSDMVAKLPLELYRMGRKGPRQVTSNAGARLMGNIPSDLHTSFELRKLMVTGKCLGGNGYARVYRDATGEPRAIQWVPPCDVEPKLLRRPNGECMVVYEVKGESTPLTRYDIIHIRGESRDGVRGISPVTLLRENIGTALSQTQAAGKLMKNGGKFPGFLKTAQHMTSDQLRDARDEFNSKYGGAINAGTVPVLNGDWDFKVTNGMSMVDAQFLESRRFELQEVARHYGIPPHLIGDPTGSTSWGSGIQEQTLGFLNFCLDPHLRNFEEALNHTLLTTDEQARGFYFRFDRDELASVSRQDTAAYFTAMRNIGVYSVNDIRAKLDEPLLAPEQGGDDYRLPLNSSSKGEPKAAEETPAPTPAEQPVEA